MKKNLKILWDDTAGQTASNTFPLAPVAGELDSIVPVDILILLNGIASITNAGIKGYSVTLSAERGDSEAPNTPPTDDTEFNTVDQKLVYTYLEEVGDDLRSRTYEFSAPKAEHFQIVPGQGKRLKKEIGDSLALSIGSAMGTTCHYKEGWLKSVK